MLRPQLRRLALRPKIPSATPSQRRSAYTLPKNVPPFRKRLRPYVPFFISWTIITSLIVHLLRARQETADSVARQKAKITVLSDLIERLRKGENVDGDQIQRDLEMVGLRKRTVLTGYLEDELKSSAEVRWSEVFFGKKKAVDAEGYDGTEEKTLEEWAQVISEASDEPPPPSDSIFITRPYQPSQEAQKDGIGKRAPGANVYL